MEINSLLKDVRLKIARGEFELAKELLFGVQSSSDSTSETSEAIEKEALKARICGFTDGFDKAQAMFFDLETVWSENFPLFKMHCKFLQEFGHYNDAIALGNTILDKFSTYPEAYELQIENYELTGNNEQAWRTCNKAIDNFPENVNFIAKQNSLGSVVNAESLADETIEEIKYELNMKHISATNENIFLFLNLFRGRRGVHAVQTKMGKSWGYIPEKRDMHEEDVRKHLNGEKTLGVYLTDINNTANFMVFDLDIRKAYMKKYSQSHEERQRINAILANSSKEMLDICCSSGLLPMIEKSGNKGLHFWFFSAEPIACKYWRVLGNWFIKRLRFLPEEISWELFPKQDYVAPDGLGNLVKLPLGIHRKTHKQSLFVDHDTLEPYSDQIKVLQNVEKITRTQFESILGAITVDSCNSETSISLVPTTQQSVSETSYAETEDRALNLSVKIPLPERNTLEVEKLLAGCRPMWLIMNKAKQEKHLEKNEKHAFIYIFAHLGDEGRVFIHQVMNQLDDYQPDLINSMIKAVPPNPTGCAKIRRHIPEYCSFATCNCQFRLPEGTYQSPVIHAGIFPNMNNFNSGNTAKQPVSLSQKESFGGESGLIDKLMQEYSELTSQIERIRERGALLRRQINKIFDDAGTDVIETRIRKYHKLPDIDEPVKLLTLNKEE